MNGQAVFADTPIDRLGSERFADRQAALRDFWASPEAARQAIEKAEREGDPETAARARWILRQWQRGLTPQTPPAIRKSLLQTAEATDPETLLDLLFEGVPEPLLTRVREGNVAAIEATAAAFDDAFLRLAIPLLRAKRSEVLLELFDLCSARPVHAVMRSELLRKLQRPAEQIRQLPTSAKKWSQWDRQIAEIWLADLCGDHDASIEMAVKYRMPKMALNSMLVRDDFAAIAKFSSEQSKVSMGMDQREWWALALCAARLADIGDVYDQSLSSLLDAPVAPEGALATAAGLMLAGENDRAIRLLNTGDTSSVIDLLKFQQRYVEALELLSIHPQTIEADLRRLTDETKELSGKARSSEYLLKLRATLQAAQLTYLVGRHQAAFETYRRLAELPLNGTQPAVGYVLLELPFSADDWRIEIVAPFLASGKLQVIDSLTKQNRNDIPWNAGVLVWKSLESMFPQTSVRNRARMIVSLANDELPDGWSRRGNLDQLAVTAEALLRKGTPTQRGRDDTSGVGSSLSQMFVRIGRPDLAELFFEEDDLPQYDPEYADEIYQRGAYVQAAELFKEQFLNGIGRDSQRCLVGWLAALEHVGNTEEAEELKQAVALLPLSSELHYRMASSYRDFQLPARDEEHLREAWRLAEPGALDGLQVSYDTSRRLREQPELAHLWAVRSLLCSLVTMNYRNQESVAMMRIYLSAMLATVTTGRDLVQKDQIEKAKSWLLWAQKLHPLEVDLAEHVTPMLREKGHQELADRLVDNIVRVAEKQLKFFPSDPTSSNNLAWVLALNDRQLDRALELANQAVRGVPDSTAYRDTLAETLARMGRVEEALMIERDCLIDTPDDWHLNKQVKRYEDLLKKK